MSHYLLSSHVHLCTTGDHMVLLDVKRDKYLAIDAAHMHVLANVVRGWPLGADPAVTEITSPHVVPAVVRQMLAGGLLTSESTLGKEATPLVMASPTSALIDELTERPAIRLGHVARFLAASVSAALALRRRSLEQIVNTVTRRKREYRQPGAVFDMERAAELVAIFVHLRPFVFTTKEACLFSSLALVNFLACYALFPTWVFGVQTRPFAAHCWVQQDSIVFNDTPDLVLGFTPIMSI